MFARSATIFKTQATATATGLELTCKLVSVQDLAKCDDRKRKTAEYQQAAF